MDNNQTERCCSNQPVINCDLCEKQLCPEHICYVTQLEKSPDDSRGDKTVRNLILCEVCARKILTYGLEDYEFVVTGKGRSVGNIKPYEIRKRAEEPHKVSIKLSPKTAFIEGLLISLSLLPIILLIYWLTGKFYTMSLFLMPILLIGYVAVSLSSKKQVGALKVSKGI